jgi:signal transduction histidine kinase
MDKLNRQLIDASRNAGMADVATGVLHNVGNVLNSVSVSATLVGERLRRSKVTNLCRATAMLRAQNGHIIEYLTNDPKGKLIPEYLSTVADDLAVEQSELIVKMTSVGEHIEHIKEIVAMQQSYARVSGVKELVRITDLVEDSLRMNLGALNRHGVEVVREFSPVAPSYVDKHKVLQIIVNLVRNAKYACDESGRPDRRLTLRVGSADGKVRIAVIDNGVGIPTENLARIFNHGFTTRKNGHGFGLHSGALAAKEMGGSLSVASDGPGQGAIFTLELLEEPVQVAAALLRTTGDAA